MKHNLSFFRSISTGKDVCDVSKESEWTRGSRRTLSESATAKDDCVLYEGLRRGLPPVKVPPVTWNAPSPTRQDGYLELHPSSLVWWKMRDRHCDHGGGTKSGRRLRRQSH